VTHIDPCGYDCPGRHDCARVKGMTRALHSPERDGKESGPGEYRGSDSVN